MIQVKTYTKYELAKELNYNTDKASNITKRLKKLGYKFSTCGKGTTYTISILALPQAGIKEFAKEYLGIECRFEEHLTHFLYLLFATGLEQFSNMAASSLEWFTPSCNDTIQDWLKALVECGLLKEELLVDSYYATQKEIIEIDYNTGDYKYTQKWKEIKIHEYEKAINAYSTIYKELMKDIKTNLDLCEDMVIFEANKERKAALNGWWANKKRGSYKLTINKDWAHYQELISLLNNYDFVNYTKLKNGNAIKDQEEWEKRCERWEKALEEKRQRLKSESKNEQSGTQPIEETNNIIATTGTPIAMRDFADMPIFDDIGAALGYLWENYIKNERGLRNNG